MLEWGFPSKTFRVFDSLIGFNPIDENMLWSNLLSGGGVDVGQYSQTSAHLIVDRMIRFVFLLEEVGKWLSLGHGLITVWTLECLLMHTRFVHAS